MKASYPALTVIRRGDTAVSPTLLLTADAGLSGASATAEVLRLATFEAEAASGLDVTLAGDSSQSTIALDPSQLAILRPGLYAVRFTVTFLDGSIGTFPPDSSMVLNLT